MSTQNNNQLAVNQQQSLTPSERFLGAVIKEFSANNGGVELSPFQKKLCQNYFICLDILLKEAEAKRLTKSEKYRDPVPITWENLDLKRLAIDVVIFSSVGLDPTQPNHISTIPYKNPKTNKYDVGFIIGYKGAELKARKYGLNIPDDIIVELIYAKDKFKAIKKDMNNKIETYLFEMSDYLDRGEIVGGFYYHIFKDEPWRNKIKTFSKRDIDKRKPEKASAEFWGGIKDKWEYDQATGKNKKVGTEEVEGWYDEMAYKTIYKAAYNSITIDSEKIDSNYVQLILRESEARDEKVLGEIKDNANKKEIVMAPISDVTDPITGQAETINNHEPESARPF